MLAHLDTGVGPALVLLHGWSLDRSTWQPQVARLVARGYRVVAPDLPGHGRSSGPDHDRSFEAMPTAVLDLITRLGLSRVVVAGLSMGSAIAVELALAAPHTIAGLVLADNAASDVDAARGAAAADRVLRTPPAVLADWYAALLFSPAFRRDRPDELARWRRQFLANDREAIAEVVRGYHSRRDVRPLLQSLDLPTVVVFGSEDATTPASRRRDYEAIPGAQRRELAGAGHLANIECPDEFTEIVHDLAERAGVVAGGRDDDLHS